MLEVNFYDNVKDDLLKFAVIVSKYRGKWVLCKHRDRNTYEFPGGHREAGEEIEATARRELYEESGAKEYRLEKICVYSVRTQGNMEDDPDKIGTEVVNAAKGYEETFGMLYFADIDRFTELPDYEIERIEFFDQLPSNWTYPEIQPKLLEKIDSLRRK